MYVRGNPIVYNDPTGNLAQEDWLKATGNNYNPSHYSDSGGSLNLKS